MPVEARKPGMTDLGDRLMSTGEGFATFTPFAGRTREKPGGLRFSNPGGGATTDLSASRVDSLVSGDWSKPGGGATVAAALCCRTATCHEHTIDAAVGEHTRPNYFCHRVVD